jgi:XTP/dITP diphosphohydrolase
MRTIVFATNNVHKTEEATSILGSGFNLITLKEIGFCGDIPETQNTLEGNALQKARFIWDKFQVDCVADDTGLEVDALGGEPGVYSARYAGPECLAENNIDKLIEKMQGIPNRNARFRTVVALIMDGKEYLFDGSVEGQILNERQGSSGFGYDPVFQPSGYFVSFAQMLPDLKNAISHRARAFKNLADYLNK